MDPELRLLAIDASKRARAESAEQFLREIARAAVERGYRKNPMGYVDRDLHQLFSTEERSALVRFYEAIGEQQLTLRSGSQSLAKHLDATSSPPAPRPERSLWGEGTFFLLAFAVIIAVLILVSRSVTPSAVPLVIVGGAIFLLLLGLLTLRRVRDVSEEGFLKGIDKVRRWVPFIRGRESQEVKEESNQPLDRTR